MIYEVQIYTFGSPSVMIEQMWEDGHFRVYLENDPVHFYHHFNAGICIEETLDWDENHPIGDVIKIDRDHSIKEYLKVLRRHNGLFETGILISTTGLDAHSGKPLTWKIE